MLATHCRTNHTCSQKYFVEILGGLVGGQQPVVFLAFKMPLVVVFKYIVHKSCTKIQRTIYGVLVSQKKYDFSA